MRAAVLLKLSARSVGRNTRRSMLTAAAMVLGLALLIFSRALASDSTIERMSESSDLLSGRMTSTKISERFLK